MKKYRVLFIITLVFLYTKFPELSAQPVSQTEAKALATAHMVKTGTENPVLLTCHSFPGEDGNPLFYYVTFFPKGFVVISADEVLPPVIACGDESSSEHQDEWIRFMTADLNARSLCRNNIPPEILSRHTLQRERLLKGELRNPMFQQWPEPGSTTTGGWLETNWTQDQPYNSLCPLDPVDGGRSIAGCPSVAMAMIVNFHQSTNGVSFSDADDYHHQYAGRNYWIDDDYQPLDFPSFPVLNEYLDSLQSHYNNGLPLTKTDKGSLVFACGIAARQVYTSSGSGTFGVDQAFDAYQKFNFTQAQLMTDSNPDLYTHIAQNIKDTLPVHLAVVDPGWTMGHNLVIDGYNTDNFFHLNFGWGGGYNGWYFLPDEIPYGLTVIEGVITDIIPGFPTGIQQKTLNADNLYPNPARDIVYFSKLPEPGSIVMISDITGKIVQKEQWLDRLTGVDISRLPQGMYLVTITGKQQQLKMKLVKL